MKNLIVYFSHNKENYVSGKIVDLKEGNVKVICKKLAEMIDADVFEILPKNEYPSNYHQCTTLAKEELQKDGRPEITNYINDIDQYENIILAFPSWWSTYPMIINTFIETYALDGKHIYPICSHEGSGMGQSESDLKKACPNSIIHKGLAIRGSVVDQCDQQLQEYINGYLLIE